MKQQTAVEFIIEEWKKKDFNQLDIFWLWRKAKEMEKEQIVKSFNDGAYWELYGSNITQVERAEKYYNETYTQSSE